MYKHILIPIDGSECAERALTHGLTLAKQIKAAVTIVVVTDVLSPIEIVYQQLENGTKAILEFEKVVLASAKAVLSAAEEKAKSAGLACRTVHVPDQHPAEGIVETADKIGADLIVMGSHGRRAIGRLMLGSVVSEVLARSKVPALVVR